MIISFTPAKYTAYLTTILYMLYLSFLQLRTQFAYFDKSDPPMDVSTVIMIFVQKVSTVHFGIADGQEKPEKIEKMSRIRKRGLVKEKPSLIEFFGFMWSFWNILSGPFCLYPEYKIFIESNKDDIKGLKNHIGRKIFDCLIFLTIGQIFTALLPLDTTVGSADFAAKSFWYKVLWAYGYNTFVCRFKFYFVWNLSEAIYSNVGFGYNKETQKWDQLEACYASKVEFATNAQHSLNNWNIMTSIWLRHVCYDRLPRSVNTLSTFVLSAVWHGFHPGQYIFFVFCNFYLEVSRKIRKSLNLWLPENHPGATTFIIQTLGILFHHMIFNWCALCFMIRSWQPCLLWLKQTYYSGFILVLIGNFIPWKSIFKVQESKKQQ